MFNLNQLRLQAIRQFKRRLDYVQLRPKSNFKDGGEHPTFNDVPIPQGSWKENYTRQQLRYNTILLSGIASFFLTVLYVAKWSKLEMNFSVPDYPYEDEKEVK